VTDERGRKDEYGMTWYMRRTLFNLAMHPLGLRGTGMRGKALVKLGFAKWKRYGVAITDEGVLVVAVLMLKGALAEPEPGRPTFEEEKTAFLAEWAAPSYQGAPPSEPSPWAGLAGDLAQQFASQHQAPAPLPVPAPGVLDDEP
jgi:hypothetical protein